jgi:hypothetical protein
MNPTKTRTTRTALALAALAVVFPTAAAARPDDRDQGVVTSKAEVAGSFVVRPENNPYLGAFLLGSRRLAKMYGVDPDVPALDPAITAALQNRIGAGRSYTPEELQALIRYSNASFAEKKAILAGTKDPFYGTHTAVRPDDRSGLRGVGPVSATQSTSSGFDWGDAGIGAIGAAGFSLLLAGGMLLTLHLVHQRRDRVAAL